MAETAICAKCGGAVNPSDQLTLYSEYTGCYFHHICPGIPPAGDAGQVDLSGHHVPEELMINQSCCRPDAGLIEQLAISPVDMPVCIRSSGQLVQIERIRSPAGLHKASWRVHCRTCGKDVCEPTDKRTAKRFMNEHKANQHHDAVLIQEGWRW